MLRMREKETRRKLKFSILASSTDESTDNDNLLKAAHSMDGNYALKNNHQLTRILLTISIRNMVPLTKFL